VTDGGSDDVIAIDGPSASGKSTVARRVARELGRLYVDSGALYRAVTWKALRDGVDTGNPVALAALVQSLQPEFFVKDGAARFRIDGIEFDSELRTTAIDRHVSPVAAVPEVRVRVVAWLRSMSALGKLVMEGRDIGTAIFPNASWKFYLDASLEERTRRRHAEMAGREQPRSAEEVGDSLKRRDRIDSGRKIDPLKIAPGARVIDSTRMSIDEVVKCVVDRSAR